MGMGEFEVEPIFARGSTVRLFGEELSMNSNEIWKKL